MTSAAVATSAHTLYTRPMRTLEHLLAITDFEEMDDIDAPELLSAQAMTTSDMLAQLGSPEYVLSEDSAQAARSAFSTYTNPGVTDAQRKQSLIALKAPAAVRHLAGMLSQYDWDYVEQAKELRGYVVAQLLEETRNKDVRIRLKSLELVGKLTEVGSFTERIEITKKDASSDELEARIRARLSSLLPKTVEIETVIPRPQDQNGNLNQIQT
jgi:hypothetical protein